MCESFRKLTIKEIDILKNQQCMSDDWSSIDVAKDFNPEHIFHTRFSGKIRMGVFEKSFTLPGGFKKHSGLRHVSLHNCTLGNNVLIENVSNYIANYSIGNDTFIQNVNVILVDGKSTFGNGTEVSVLNETGGREVPIYNKMSAHLAYIIAMYRHRPILIEKLKKMIDDYASEVSSETGYIGENVSIINTGTIKNVCIGDCCIINGTSKLENGTINSNSTDPVTIGCNVMADDFIISSGSHISDGVVMLRCFI